MLRLTFIVLFASWANLSQAVLFSASGPDATAIQATVDAFRAAVGNPNNGNAIGTQPSGRREINWDGGGAAANATVFANPMTNFNGGATPRGAVFITPGTGFEISGQPNPEFGDINPSYPAIFNTFSAPRLFTPLGSNVLDVSFFVPGTNFPAAVSGFGAVFTDVDLANVTSLQFFSGNVSEGTFFVPAAAGSETLSFLGATFTDPITRVRITAGNTAVGPSDGGATDIVVMDDFIFAEPRAVTEPASFALSALALLLMAGFVFPRPQITRARAW